MHVAYDVCVKNQYDSIRQPKCLPEAARDHAYLCEVSLLIQLYFPRVTSSVQQFGPGETMFGSTAHKGEIFRARKK